MGYLIDRQRAVLGADLVAVLAVRSRGARSRLVLTDNSLLATLSRPGTVRRAVNGGRRQRTGARVTWWMP